MKGGNGDSGERKKREIHGSSVEKMNGGDGGANGPK